MFDFFIKKLGKLKSRNYNSGMDFTKQTNKNSALVMEGGGMRGLFTCGVIDVFMENGIDFDMAVGVSAGVTFGCNIKSKQIGRPLRYTKKYRNDKRYSSIHSLVTTGDLFNVEFCYHTIPEELDIFDTKTFAENPMKFYCVATNCLTGKAVYHLCFDGKTSDIDWIRASASLPVVSRPVEIDGGKYLDGGVSDSVPFAFAKEQGYEKLVLVLTKQKGYRKQKSKFLPIIKIACKKYPAIIENMKRRHIVYNKQMEDIDALEERGEIFVVRPPHALDMKVTEKDLDKLQYAYDCGRQTATDCLPKLKAYLNLI